MPRKHLRQLFNQSRTKCRFCKQAKRNGVSNGGVCPPNGKPLFHPRHCSSHIESIRELNTNRSNPQESENTRMAEELEELERVRNRFERECRKARRVRENVRRLYRKLEAHTMNIEEHMRHYGRGDLADSMDTLEFRSISRYDAEPDTYRYYIQHSN